MCLSSGSCTVTPAPLCVCTACSQGSGRAGPSRGGGGVAAVPEGTAAKCCTHPSGQGGRLKMSDSAAPAPAPLAQDTGTGREIKMQRG